MDTQCLAALQSRKEHHQQAKVACSPYLSQLLDQKDYTGDAASAVPEEWRRLDAGAGRLGSLEHSIRVEPQMLQHCLIILIWYSLISICCLSPVYTAATEQTSKPWAKLNLVSGGSHGNEAAAALIPQGQTSQTNILIPKQGFRVHLDPIPPKLTTTTKKKSQKRIRKKFLQEERDHHFMLGGFPKGRVISQIQPTGFTCTLDVGSNSLLK